MQAGLLTGSFTRERAQNLDENDWRKANPEFTGDALERNLKLADALRPIAAKHNTSMGTIALAWVLAWPGIGLPCLVLALVLLAGAACLALRTPKKGGKRVF